MYTHLPQSTYTQSGNQCSFLLALQDLLQLIAKLKDELVREHKEKQDLEERLRRELCKEFSQQLVEIQNAWR